ncbi:hypothetical protein [Oceanobacillus piezotolerans]|uniref:hypothetical protein n=1 Tax=Oceanobacillus piezotolerans TaxID=2448030 RepID=UPI00319DBA62
MILSIFIGTASAVVNLQIAALLDYREGSSGQIILSTFMTSVIAALTVGGKAVEKSFAINSSTHIISFAGRVLYYIGDKTNIKIIPKK